MKTLFTIVCWLIPLFSWGQTHVTLDSASRFVQKIDDRFYLNIEMINEVRAARVVWTIKGNIPLYIPGNRELQLKSGWVLQGETGKERLVKMSCDTTSGIVIHNAGNIRLSNFQLTVTYENQDPPNYIPAPHNALVKIDNQSGTEGRIELLRLNITGHYSGIWVRRGTNIEIRDCQLIQNAHQIYLGYLGDPDYVADYSVSNLLITGCKITDSLGGGSDGVKTLSNCTRIVISNNLIEYNELDGIDLYPGGVGVEIVNNTIQNNGVHGIEVKMARPWLPDQTGQIEYVLIRANRVQWNGNDGIACLGKETDFYAQGIEIANNQVRSNGHYAIRSEIPIQITDNFISGNGLIPNASNPTAGYTGIYILNQIRDEEIIVSGNRVIDQAPITGIDVVYWMTLNNIKGSVAVKGNTFEVSSGYHQQFPGRAYGLWYNQAVKLPTIVDNTFNGSFVETINPF